MVSSWFLVLKKLLKFNLRLLMKGFSKAAKFHVVNHFSSCTCVNNHIC